MLSFICPNYHNTARTSVIQWSNICRSTNCTLWLLHKHRWSDPNKGPLCSDNIVHSSFVLSVRLLRALPTLPASSPTWALSRHVQTRAAPPSRPPTHTHTHTLGQKEQDNNNKHPLNMRGHRKTAPPDTSNPTVHWSVLIATVQRDENNHWLLCLVEFLSQNTPRYVSSGWLKINNGLICVYIPGDGTVCVKSTLTNDIVLLGNTPSLVPMRLL